MNNRKDFVRIYLMISIMGFLAMVNGFALAYALHEVDGLKKHPTYHCDGSTTMGYAAPGTPEAAACWIEGGEK